MPEASYAWDVFISYSHKDEDWVYDELLPRLEASGLKVCIDERDFEFGVPALVNMERAVDHSRHTLLVLTPRWASSEWTDFEVLLAGTGDPVGRRRKTIPLMLEKCDLPTRISMLTYADFTRPERRERVFARLIRSLGGNPDAARGAGAGTASPQPGAPQPGTPQPGASQPSPPRPGRVRPATPGVSVSHYSSGAATLGCLVVGRADPAEVSILSDFSGLCAANAQPNLGDAVIQPGRHDGGTRVDILAKMSRFALVSDDPADAATNVSAAIARVRRTTDVSPEIPGLGTPKGVRGAVEGETVSIVGRTSGPARGEVLQTVAQVSLRWPIYGVREPLRSTGDGQTVPVLFSDLIETTPLLKPGDSGALLMAGDGHALGLGFAGSGETSVFLPIQRVLDALEVDLVTSWPL